MSINYERDSTRNRSTLFERGYDFVSRQHYTSNAIQEQDYETQNVTFSCEQLKFFRLFQIPFGSNHEIYPLFMHKEANTSHSSSALCTPNYPFSSNEEAEIFTLALQEVCYGPTPKQTFPASFFAAFKDAPEKLCFAQILRSFQLRYLLEKFFPASFKSYFPLLVESTTQLNKREAIRGMKDFSHLIANPQIPSQLLSSFLLLGGFVQQFSKKFNSNQFCIRLNAIKETPQITVECIFSDDLPSLFIDGDFLKALETILSSFSQNSIPKDAIKQFNELYASLTPCFIMAKFSPVHDHYDAVEKAIIPLIAKKAFEFLKTESLAYLGFSLLCICGEVENSLEHLPLLLQYLPPFLFSDLNSNTRVQLLRHFLQYFLSCSPQDPMKKKIHLIEELCLQLTNESQETKVLALESLCKLFSASHETKIVAESYPFFQMFANEETSIKRFRELGQLLINFYLSPLHRLNSEACEVFILLVSKPNILFQDVDSLFAKLLKSARKSTENNNSMKLIHAFRAWLEKIKRPPEIRFNYSALIPLLLEQISALETLHLLQLATVTKNLKPDSEASFAESKLLVAKKLFLEGQIKEAFETWESASAVADPFKAFLRLLLWRIKLEKSKSTLPEHWSLYVHALLQICTPQYAKLKTKIVDKLIEQIQKQRPYLQSSNGEKPWEFLSPKGQWLLQNVLTYPKIAKSQPFTFYTGLIQSSGIEIANPNFGRALQQIGAHFFYSVALDMPQSTLESEVRLLAIEMLNSQEQDLRVAGFLLACRCQAMDEKIPLFELLFAALPQLLLDVDEPLLRVTLLSACVNCYDDYFPKLSTLAVYNRLCSTLNPETGLQRNKKASKTPFTRHESNNEMIIQAFCLAFQRYDGLEAVSKTIHSLWQSCDMPTSSCLELIAATFMSSPNQAKFFLSTIKKDAFLSFEASEPILKPLFQNAVVLYSNQKLSLEHIEILNKLLIHLCKTCKSKPSTILKGHILWFVEVLSQVNVEACIQIFELLEQKGIVLISSKKWMELNEMICRTLYKKQRKVEAFQYWDTFTSRQIDSSCMALLKEWLEHDKSEQLVQLILKVFERMPSFPETHYLFQELCAYFPQVPLSSSLGCSITEKVPSLLSYLKHFVNVQTFFTLFSQLCPFVKDPFIFIDNASFHKPIKAILSGDTHAQVSLFLDQLSTSSDANAAVPLELQITKDSRAFYFYLASKAKLTHVFVAYRALSRALSITKDSEKQIGAHAADTVLLSDALECTELLIAAKYYEQAVQLLQLIDNFFSIENEKTLFTWEKLCFQLKGPAAAEILISKHKNFAEKGELYATIQSKIFSLCKTLLSEGQQTSAFTLAFLYNLHHMGFWKIALLHLKPEDSATESVLEKLTAAPNLIKGLRKDLQPFWNYIIQLCLTHYPTLFANLLPVHHNLFELFSTESASFPKEKAYHTLHQFLLGLIQLPNIKEKFSESEIGLLECCLIETSKLKGIRTYYREHHAEYLTLVNKLLSSDSPILFEMGCIKICIYTSFKNFSIKSLGALTTKAIQKCSELKLNNNSPAVLKLKLLTSNELIDLGIEFNTFLRHLHIPALLEFYSQFSLSNISREALIYFCTRLADHLDFLHHSNNALSLQDKNTIKSFIVALETYSGAACAFYYSYFLIHECSTRLFSPVERSERVAKVIHQRLDNSSTDSVESISDGFMNCYSYLPHLTHPNEHEMTCLKKLIDRLFLIITKFDSYQTYRVELYNLINHLSDKLNSEFKLKWNSPYVTELPPELHLADTLSFETSYSILPLPKASNLTTEPPNTPYQQDVSYKPKGPSLFTQFLELLLITSIPNDTLSEDAYIFYAKFSLKLMIKISAFKLISAEKLFVSIIRYAMQPRPEVKFNQGDNYSRKVFDLLTDYFKNKVRAIVAKEKQPSVELEIFSVKIQLLGCSLNIHSFLNLKEISRCTLHIVSELEKHPAKLHLFTITRIMIQTQHLFYPTFYSGVYFTHNLGLLRNCYQKNLNKMMEFPCLSLTPKLQPHFCNHPVSCLEAVSKVLTLLPKDCPSDRMKDHDIHFLLFNIFSDFIDGAVTIVESAIVHADKMLAAEKKSTTENSEDAETLKVNVQISFEEDSNEGSSTIELDEDSSAEEYDVNLVIPNNHATVWRNMTICILINLIHDIAKMQLEYVHHTFILKLLEKCIPLAVKSSADIQENFYKNLKFYFEIHSGTPGYSKCALICLNKWLAELQESGQHEIIETLHCIEYRKSLVEIIERQ